MYYCTLYHYIKVIQSHSNFKKNMLIYFRFRLIICYFSVTVLYRSAPMLCEFVPFITCLMLCIHVCITTNCNKKKKSQYFPCRSRVQEQCPCSEPWSPMRGVPFFGRSISFVALPSCFCFFSFIININIICPHIYIIIIIVHIYMKLFS